MSQEDKEQEGIWLKPRKAKAGLQQIVLKKGIRDFIQRRTAKNEGKYLPLSVYATQGFCTDLIKADASTRRS